MQRNSSMTAFHLDTDTSKETWKSYEVNKKIVLINDGY